MMRFNINPDILQAILAENKKNDFFAIKTSRQDFLNRMTRLVGCVVDGDAFKFITCTVTGFLGEPKRTDVYFFMINPREDDLQSFIQHLDRQLDESSKNQSSLRDFFEENWAIDQSKYPLFFHLSVNTEQLSHSTINLPLFCVAPCYRGKGIMKILTLDVLEFIQAAYPDVYFHVTATVIHPATYLFFKPKDKSLHGFDGIYIADIPLEKLLGSHGRTHTTDTNRTFLYANLLVSLFYRSQHRGAFLITNQSVENDFRRTL